MNSSLVTRPSSLNFWCVIPAAGIGKRMGSEIPKQYLELNGRAIILHTLDRLLAHPSVNGAIVALSRHDGWWEHLDTRYAKPVTRIEGGIERCHSVLNALHELALHADDADWVLVHDAARPCLAPSDLEHLMTTLAEDEVGGLLAVPVRDTMKRAEASGRVVDTVEREGLWHALTPQMFRLGLLRSALENAIEAEQLVTDEASAMEYAGYQPLLVEGSTANIKITRPEDLALAEFYLQQQEQA
ncbi:2-C-methyl-D-erythritol 4-phosphate cytidylyltransferase [Thiohalophilus sp.]|uniref:2-C-methyl-D-erythritol 4-phosphate cytidylyltransferase n=1 Tax=Thiohalophilus sp. TaxID=3028392 RepID=UPI002ACD8F26|nr:2-C-methyl-D-erythritol 4-phosphate cytidylyltransferase [Thiohalophilus sp.]MDZ7663163.1 2-C-methyl-D-erythritol 4-phosphate cytidylyltransferase [Thiohalophilus sp.]